MRAGVLTAFSLCLGAGLWCAVVHHAAVAKAVGEPYTGTYGHSRCYHQSDSMNFEQVKKVLGAFEAEGVEYVVFGAAAINLLGLPRATEDLDVFIAPSAENVERLKKALRAVFDDPNIDAITADDLLGDYPAVQYVPPEGTFYLDILTRLGEVYRFENVVSMRVDFDGLKVNVATPETLYEMKKATVRPKDWGDAETLRRRFGLGEK